MRVPRRVVRAPHAPPMCLLACAVDWEGLSDPERLLKCAAAPMGALCSLQIPLERLPDPLEVHLPVVEDRLAMHGCGWAAQVRVLIRLM